MIGATVKVQERLIAAVGPDSPPVKKAKFRNFGHAAASIRRDAQQSIKPAPKEERRGPRTRKGKRTRRGTHAAASAGQPVRTQRGAYRRAIIYHADEHGAMIGPRFSVIGASGQAHEHGGEYMGGTYPQRAVMGPALERQAARFSETWRGSIGPN